ncbi:flavodoxin [Atopobacter phocae]|uniref:flavodoxin n=1 Tax=Atopobacter phocae TaxID=136492 RepID=UPI000470E710|nr:flavodoxin [Atopobacter phocae]
MAKALIIYASLTGNTEEICDILADALEERGIEVDMDNSSQAMGDDFLDYDICIVGTYTYGTDGDLPDEIVDLYEDLAEIDLTGKLYAAVGSGDTFYEKFCQSVIDFDEQLAKTGATKGGDMVMVNLNPEEEDIIEIERLADQLKAAVEASGN